MKVRYLFLFSLLTAILTLTVLVVYGSFFDAYAWYLLPIMATSASITVVLPLLSLCHREIAGRWYTTLAFSFLLGHFASFTWWSFSPSSDDILTSYSSLSPAVLLLCSYFLMNLSTALFFAVLSFAVELVQSLLILAGRPDIPNNVNMFESRQVWLYLLDGGHVTILFLLVFLLLQAWQEEHEGDLHEAERLLVDTQRRAEQNNLNKSVFMSALAHDIRTPLNGIMAGLALTLDDPILSLSNEHRDYLQMAHSSASSLLYLLNDILDISRLDSCSLHFERVEFDLVETVERTVRSFALDAERQSLQLMVDVSTTVPTAVRGDPVRLTQLLSNILSNALKFSERGGAVTVSCEAVTLDSDETAASTAAEGYENSVVVDVNKRSVRFVPVGTASSSPRLRRSPRTGLPAARLLPVTPAASSSTARTERHPHGRVCLHFAVRDEGCGIPADRLQSVFGRFEQASHDVAQLYAGRGLGLAIAAGLVRLFEGKIWCESVVKPAADSVLDMDDVQHGSTFHFLIHLDLLPSNSHPARLADDDSTHTPSGSSPLSAARSRQLDSVASSPTPKADDSLLSTALARVRRLAHGHSRNNSGAAQTASSASAALSSAIAAAAPPAGPPPMSSRISAVSARLISQATGSSTAASGGTAAGSSPQLRVSVSVSTGEPVSAVLRRELLSLRPSDSPLHAAGESKASRPVAVVAPRSPSGPSNERRQAWQRWCTKYAAVLVCITPQQTRLAVSGWVKEWHGRKRAEGRTDEEKPREPAVVPLESEAQLMGSMSEYLTAMQLHRESPLSPRRDAALHPSAVAAAEKSQSAVLPAASALLSSRSSMSSTRTDSAVLRDDSSAAPPNRLLLIIDDFLASAEPAATATLTTAASALAAAVGLGTLPHSVTPPAASPNLSFPSAARHSHLTRNRHAAKCLKMVSTLLKARQCDSEVQIDVLFLLSAGSAAMRVDWPGLRYSGSMTSPASRLSLYRLMEAAATGVDGGGGERTVLYRAAALPQASPRPPLLSFATTAASLQSTVGGSEQHATAAARTLSPGTPAAATGSDMWQASTGTVVSGALTSSRTSSPGPHLSALATAGPTSRLSDGTSSGMYVPSSRSALVSLAAVQRKQVDGLSARTQANEPVPLSPRRQQQRREAAESVGLSGMAGQSEAEKDKASPTTLSTSSTPRPRPPLVLRSSASLSRSTNTNEPAAVSTPPLPSPSAAAVVIGSEQADNSATAGRAGIPPSSNSSSPTAAADQPCLPRAASLFRRSESLPSPPLTHDADSSSPHEARQSPTRASASLPPLLLPSLSPSRSVSAPAAAGPSLGCVLVVDDNLINRKMAASVLKRMGLQSQLCESGEDALAVLQHSIDAATGASRFVCCLMDIRMPPGISGHECSRLIRLWEKQRQQAVERAGEEGEAAVSGPAHRLPIFALTANVLDDDRQLAVEVGMDAYLEKPLNAALLKQQLTKFGIATTGFKSKGSTAPHK